VGGAVRGVVAVAAIFALAWYFVSKNRQAPSERGAHNQSGRGPPEMRLNSQGDPFTDSGGMEQTGMDNQSFQALRYPQSGNLRSDGQY
jgi:hypothetical protein